MANADFLRFRARRYTTTIGVHKGPWSLLHHGMCRYRLPVATSDTPTVQNATTNLLDEVRKVKGIGSDYALAKLLAVRQQTITNYRSGRTQMNDTIAIRVARMMARPPASLLAQLASERAKDPEVAKVWKDAARTLGRKSHGA